MGMAGAIDLWWWIVKEMGPRLFQGNLGWWNIMNHLARWLIFMVKCMPVNILSVPVPWESKVNLELEGLCFVFFCGRLFYIPLFVGKKITWSTWNPKDLLPIETGGFWKTRETNIFAPENWWLEGDPFLLRRLPDRGYNGHQVPGNSPPWTSVPARRSKLQRLNVDQRRELVTWLERILLMENPPNFDGTYGTHVTSRPSKLKFLNTFSIRSWTTWHWRTLSFWGFRIPTISGYIYIYSILSIPRNTYTYFFPSLLSFIPACQKGHSNGPERQLSLEFMAVNTLVSIFYLGKLTDASFERRFQPRLRHPQTLTNNT